MRRPRPAPRFGLLALLLSLPAGAAGEEVVEYPPITAAQIQARDFRPGEKRSVTGKYQELTNRELRLYDVQAKFLLNSPHLLREILEFKPEKSNLILLGSFQSAVEPGGAGGDGLHSFNVERIEAAPSDVEIFEGRLRGLLEQPRPAVGKLLELGEEIASALRRFGDPGLLPLGRRTYTEAFSRAEAGLGRDDADGRLSLIQKIHRSLADPELTVELLRTQARRHPTHGPTRRLLAELRCVQVRGEWLAYPEFKRRLGFVPHGSQWVKPARKEFLEVIQELRKEEPVNMVLRSRTDREYLLLARSGKVEKGMIREELAEALGLPDRVERRVEEGVEIDQWNYGDRRIYFLNGQVATVLP